MQTPNNSAPARLLWTGGWDSTFRLLHLLLVEGRSVQPYYVIDRPKYRPAVPQERQAMQRIRELLQAKHPEAAARLHPTIECAFADIAPDERTAAWFEQCLKHRFVGGQYEWLARFCIQRGIDDMELSIHRDDKAREILVELVDPSRARLDSRFSGDGRYELFKFFRFPLFDRTKQEMRAAARAAGFEDLMRETWFCHRPKGNQPCGVCNPCIYTIEEGLGDRLPAAAHRRYHLRVIPRLRHALARHTSVYLKVRSVYRSIRGIKRPVAAADAVRT